MDSQHLELHARYLLPPSKERNLNKALNKQFMYTCTCEIKYDIRHNDFFLNTMFLVLYFLQVVSKFFYTKYISLLDSNM